MATAQTEPPAPAAAGGSSNAAAGTSAPHPPSPPLVPRPPSPLGATRQTNEQLAGLLATAYSDIAQLKQDLAQATRRAEVAERVAKSLGPASSSSANGTGSGAPGTSGAASGAGAGGSTSELIQRITNLELQLEAAQGQLLAERDRRGHLYNHWCSVEEYLIGLERTAQETRRTFTGALQAEALGASPVSPVGYSIGQRRSHRELDDTHGPPSKRSKGNDGRGRGLYGDPTFHDPRTHAPPGPTHRMIQPPSGAGSKHHRSPSRDSSHSSVDDMLMDTVKDDERRSQPMNGIQQHGPGAGPSGVPGAHGGAGVRAEGSATVASSHGRSRKGEGRAQPVREEVHYPPAAYRQPVVDPGTPYPANQSAPRPAGSLGQQQYQTHHFVPPVTGAPIKKSKYGSTAGMALDAPGSLGSLTGIGGLPTGPLFGPTNEQGQRICRQCGQPGRYKDGKCVEKWGPGPAGPGTVCDRCRKKMKRVERRGTLESQQFAAQAQLAAQASLANLAQSQSQSQHLESSSSSRSLQRTDTIPANASPAPKEKGAAPPKVSHVRTLMPNSVTSSGKDNRHSPLPLRNATQNNSHYKSSSLSNSHDERSSQQKMLVKATGTGKMTGTSKPASSSSAANGNGNGKVHGGGEAEKVVAEASDSDADADAEAEGEVENEILVTLGGSSTSRSREEEEEESVEEQTQTTEIADGDGEDELDGDGEEGGDVDMEGDGEGEVEDELLSAVEAASK